MQAQSSFPLHANSRSLRQSHARAKTFRRSGNGSSLLSGVRAMVVEDDPENAKLIAVVLQHCGCRIVIASDADEAVAQIDEHQPDLIVLDLVLPRRSGILFAEELKAQPKGRDIVIVAVTAFNGPGTEALVLAVGCSAYVRKPIDVNAFPSLIAAVLRDARRQRDL